MSSPRLSARMERASWVAVLCCVVLVPLTTSNLSFLSGMWPSLERPLTLDQGALPKLVVLLLCVALSLLFRAVALLTDRPCVRFNFPALLLHAFPLVAALSLLTSVDVSTSLTGAPLRREGLFAIVAYAMLAWLVLQTVRGRHRLRLLTALVAATGALIALYGLHQAMGIDPQQWGERLFEERRTFATLGNPDFFAGYLVLVLPLPLVLALVARTRTGAIASFSAFALVAAALALSGVRTGWAGGLVALVVFALALYRQGFHPLRGQVIAASAIVAVALLAAAVWAPGGGLLGRVRSAFAEEGSLSTRVLIWRGSLDALAERPLLGWGPDAFRYAWLQHEVPEYVARFAAQGIPDVAHSLPLQLAVTTGLLGALAYIAPFAVALVRSRRVVFGRGKGPTRLMVSAWWASVAGYLTFLSAGLTDVASHALFWVALGILLDVRAEPTHLRPALLRAGATLAALVLVAFVVPSAMLLAADRAAQSGVGQPRCEDAYSCLNRAVALAPWDHRYKVLLGDAYAREVVNVAMAPNGSVSKDVEAEARKRTKRAVEEYERALADVPREINASGGIVRVLRFDERISGTQRDDRIREYGERFGRYAPIEPQLQSEVLRSLYNLERWEELAQRLVRYERVDPGAAAWRARIEWETGNRDKARALVELLVHDRAGDPRVIEVAEITGVTSEE